MSSENNARKSDWASVLFAVASKNFRRSSIISDMDVRIPIFGEAWERVVRY
jgi:hypothetical protein